MDTATLREMPSSLNDACRKLELAAGEISRLQAAKTAALKVADERSKENVALRDDRWKHGAESMRHAILQLLPGGQSCDPQHIADIIRAIDLPR